MEFGGRTPAVTGAIAADAFVRRTAAAYPAVERARGAGRRHAARPVDETPPAPEPRAAP